MDSYTLELRINDRIGRITFGHPSKNAMTSEMLNKLADLIDKANESKLCAIVISSEGSSVFCAGANFDELLELENEKQATAFFSGFAKVILAIRRSKAMIIGRVQGKSVGGGVGLIASCDYCYATETASIKLSEIGIGIAPLVIEPVVSRKIGVGAMAEFALNPNEWKNSEWAQNNKLYQSVYSSEVELDKALEEKLHQLATYSPDALSALKYSLWEGTEHYEDLLFKRAEESGKLSLTKKARSILTAFKNRRNA